MDTNVRKPLSAEVQARIARKQASIAHVLSLAAAASKNGTLKIIPTPVVLTPAESVLRVTA